MTLYVNGEPIDERAVEAEIARLKARHAQELAKHEPAALEEMLRETAREGLIERTVLRHAAAAASDCAVSTEDVDNELDEMIHQHGGMRKFLEKFHLTEDQLPELRNDIEDNLRVAAMLDGVAGTVPEPTPADIRAFYDAGPEHFSTPKTVHASHIVKQPKSEEDAAAVFREMQSILIKLRAGADFAEMASRCSDCPDQGGDLGWFRPGQMVQEFESVVFAMEPSTVSEVFQTPFGYHIAKVHEVKPAVIRPFEEVSEDIARELPGMLRQRAIQEFVAAKRAQATIEDK